MNRYHEFHPDPDIRQKFKEWQAAVLKSNGYGSHAEQEDAKRKDREARKSMNVLLNNLGGQKVKGSKFATKASGKQAHKRMRTMQRTGGQRGS